MMCLNTFFQQQHQHQHIHTYTHICIHTHTHTNIHTRTNTHIHTFRSSSLGIEPFQQFDPSTYSEFINNTSMPL